MKIKRQTIKYVGSRKDYQINDRNPEIIPVQSVRGGIIAVNLNYISSESKKDEIESYITETAEKRDWDFSTNKFYNTIEKAYPEISHAVRHYKKSAIR